MLQSPRRTLTGSRITEEEHWKYAHTAAHAHVNAPTLHVGPMFTFTLLFTLMLMFKLILVLVLALFTPLFMITFTFLVIFMFFFSVCDDVHVNVSVRVYVSFLPTPFTPLFVLVFTLILQFKRMCRTRFTSLFAIMFAFMIIYFLCPTSVICG